MAEERDHLRRQLGLQRALADPPGDIGDTRTSLDGELALVKQLVGPSAGGRRLIRSSRLSRR
jgi:hypothetical protein